MASIAHSTIESDHALLRRLMVTCPHTGRSVDTGYELTQIPALSRDAQTLIDCLEFGEDHVWGMDQAFLG